MLKKQVKSVDKSQTYQQDINNKKLLTGATQENLKDINKKVDIVDKNVNNSYKALDKAYHRFLVKNNHINGLPHGKRAVYKNDNV